MSLAVKYRPKVFTDVVDQNYIIDILNYQLETGKTKGSYLFIGPAGCGKTTVARILANELNGGQGQPTEIDAASNNGVDDVRNIIDQSGYNAIGTKNRVFILDEVHMFTVNAWNAMLKLLEEPPINTVFILCTTDPQKIPATIFSRVQRYDFQKISSDKIRERLIYILNEEGFTDFEDGAIDYITKISNGGLRDSITFMEKCLDYSRELTVDNVVKCLGIIDYDILFDFAFFIVEGNDEEALKLIEHVNKQGKDLRLFIRDAVNLFTDIIKFSIIRDIGFTDIPSVYKNDLDELTTSYVDENQRVNDLTIFYNALDMLISLQQDIKYNNNPKIYIQAKLLLFMRKE